MLRFVFVLLMFRFVDSVFCVLSYFVLLIKIFDLLIAKCISVYRNSQELREFNLPLLVARKL